MNLSKNKKNGKNMEKRDIQCWSNISQDEFIKKKSLIRIWRKGNLYTRLVAVGTATMKNNMEFLHKIKTELPYDSTIPLLGIYPKELKSEY